MIEKGTQATRSSRKFSGTNTSKDQKRVEYITIVARMGITNVNANPKRNKRKTMLI